MLYLMLRRATPFRSLTIAGLLLAAAGAASRVGRAAEQPVLEGAWTLSRTIEAPLFDCVLSDMELKIEQTDATFFGRSRGGVTKCGLLGQGAMASNIVHAGTISGREISFRLGRDAHFRGTLAAGKVSGVASIVAGGETRTGTFTMTRRAP